MFRDALSGFGCLECKVGIPYIIKCMSLTSVLDSWHFY